MLGPALLAFMLGQWLLGPVGLDRERESGTLCSHRCQVLPQQRYCENCNAFYVIFQCNCFKILTEVIKGCVWTSTRWQGTWNQICNGDFSVKMGKTPLLAAALQKQPSWPPSTQNGRGRGQPVCSVSRAVCCYLGCVCPRQSPGHGGQQGDPRGDVARSAVPCCGLSPLDVSVCCATATAVTPGKRWGQSWSWSGAGGCWVVPAALLVLMHTVTSCRTGSTRQRRLKYFL